eukprot:15444474-Alexandrium_andersonii.AAC.1
MFTGGAAQAALALELNPRAHHARAQLPGEVAALAVGAARVAREVSGCFITIPSRDPEEGELAVRDHEVRRRRELGREPARARRRQGPATEKLDRVRLADAPSAVDP